MVDINNPNRNNITEKQLEIAALLEKGLKKKQIAEKLNINPSYITQVLEIIMHKLKLWDKSQIIPELKKRGLL